MTLIDLTAVLIIGLLAAMALYAYARWRRLYAVVDLLWSLGVMALALWLWFVAREDSLRSLVTLLLVAAWSLRLSWHILQDRVLPGREDGRYLNLLQHWGEKGPARFLYVFLAQVPTAIIFAVPVYVAMSNPVANLRWVDALGILVAIISISGELAADAQLQRFRKDPANRGHVCQTGLWRYSRHPNYFFEFLYWWSFVALSWGSPYFVFSLSGPALMYVFLNYVSGIPHTERQALASRGDNYRKYQQTTNTFWPWIPRKPQA